MIDEGLAIERSSDRVEQLFDGFGHASLNVKQAMVREEEIVGGGAGVLMSMDEKQRRLFEEPRLILVCEIRPSDETLASEWFHGFCESPH